MSDERSSNPSNGLWGSLRALRDGYLDTVTLKRQQADEILRTNELLQRLVCDLSNSLMSDTGRRIVPSYPDSRAEQPDETDEHRRCDHCQRLICQGHAWTCILHPTNRGTENGEVAR